MVTVSKFDKYAGGISGELLLPRPSREASEACLPTSILLKFPRTSLMSKYRPPHTNLSFSPSNLQNFAEKSQMRSGFVQKSLSQCSRFGAMFHVCGPHLLTSWVIYQQAQGGAFIGVVLRRRHRDQCVLTRMLRGRAFSRQA
jgi:hypothetical protein